MSKTTEGRFELGDFELQSGAVIPNAFLGYATHGTLNEARDNVIIYPTWYTGRHSDAEPYIGPNKALDPERYFIVVPDMFTNGLSSSPSNCAPPLDGLNFPLVTPFDNVVAQYRLLSKHFGVTSVELAMGFSMSGQQAYHWGAVIQTPSNESAPYAARQKLHPTICSISTPTKPPWNLLRDGTAATGRHGHLS